MATVTDLLELDGTLPQIIEVVDVTPADHATPLFAVRLDYGWAQTITSGEYEHIANAIALAWSEALGVPVDLTLSYA